MPVCHDLFNYWRRNKEISPIKKAVRFLMLSNFSYLGNMDCFHLSIHNTKRIILSRIDAVKELLYDTVISNKDYKVFLNVIHCRKATDRDRFFIYADPPYLNTTCSSYNTDKWTYEDSRNLFDILANYGCKFAISEFDSPLILELTKKYKLDIINICERRNLKNRRNEILITNYSESAMLFG